MDLINLVRSFEGSLEDSLSFVLTTLAFGSFYFEALPLVKPSKFNLPEACIFLSTLMAKV
jgi:hypothetical protein